MNNQVYDIVTDEIIKLLEKGVVPWHKPWKAGGMPKNLISKKEYRGLNVFLLSCSPYGSPWWLSFKQCQSLGGHIKKGEKSTLVIFWKQILVDNREGILDGKDKPVKVKIPVLRYSRVFNLEQTEGIDLNKIPVAELHDNNFNPIEECERIIDAMPDKPDISHEGARACYSPFRWIISRSRN